MKKKLLTVFIGLIIIVLVIGGLVVLILNLTNKPVTQNNIAQNSTNETTNNTQTVNNTVTNNTNVEPTPNTGAPLLTTQISINTLGDSVTAGEGDPTHQGFQTPLKDYMKTIKLDSPIKNYAQSSATSSDLTNQISKTIQDKPKIALVLIGTNDILKFYQLNSNPTAQQEAESLAKFSENINSIVSQLTQNGIKTYVGLLDDVTKRPAFVTKQLRQEKFPTITDAAIPKISAQVKKFNEEIKSAAQNNGAFVVDFYNTTIFTDSTKVSADGLHPNAKGYTEMAKVWFDSVKNIVGI